MLAKTVTSKNIDHQSRAESPQPTGNSSLPKSDSRDLEVSVGAPVCQMFSL